MGGINTSTHRLETGQSKSLPGVDIVKGIRRKPFSKVFDPEAPSGLELDEKPRAMSANIQLVKRNINNFVKSEKFPLVLRELLDFKVTDVLAKKIQWNMAQVLTDFAMHPEVSVQLPKNLREVIASLNVMAGRSEVLPDNVLNGLLNASQKMSYEDYLPGAIQ